MDDPRFKHVATDPRFKAISKKSRKVIIDSRFQSMFTGDQFKIKYKVDKRGRKVNKSSSDDLRKYYELEGSSSGPVEEEVERKVKEEIASVCEEGVASTVDGRPSSEESDVSSGLDPEEESSSDEDICFLGDNDSSTEVMMDTWRESQEEVATADETSRRLAVCNMDWDHLEARDVYVLLSSFKPAGSSILSVAIYPSNFGLERIACEEIEGPVELMDAAEGEELSGTRETLTSKEGKKYSEEKLRQYQLGRLKYYYAIVECDVLETAEHIYEQSNDLEYEHSGGQLDLRFVPDDMTFDDRQPTSMVREGNLVNSDYKPPFFVSSAMQQSKVKLTWDETNPNRVKLTHRKFTQDDLQSMDFSAYLASSSDGEEEGSSRDKAACYKALLEERGEDDSDEVNEEMEVTWEHGLKASAEDLVKKKKKKTEEDLGVRSPWETFLKKRKEKRKETKRRRMGKTEEKEEGNVEGGEGDSGFDDPFFQHDVTTATARTAKRSQGKRKKELSNEELQSKRELELLVMSDDEGEGRQHFNLPSILRSEKDPKKKKKKRKVEKEESQTADNFKVDVADDRFKAMYESHLYAPDPSAPQYRATKGMGEIMEERRKRVVKALKHNSSTAADTSSIPSVHSLLKSVKAKTASFQRNKRKSALTSEQTKQ